MKKNSARLRVRHIILIVVLAAIISISGIAALFGIRALSEIRRNIPDLEHIDVTPAGVSSFVYDTEGNQTAKLVAGSANRILVSSDMVPENLKNAFVAIEDTRFYKHHGVDPMAILRAAWHGIRNRKLSEGGSTITQQLIKNNLFTNWTQETLAESFERKIQEQYLALKLEKQMSKEEILLNYMNTINLGHGTLGVQAASLRYFNRNVADLTLSECSVLACITQNPSRYDPLDHPENNAVRRKIVLDKMLDLHYITESQYLTALSDDVYTRIKEADETAKKPSINSYFVDALTTQLVADLQAEGYSEQQAYSLIYSGGLSIFSTQDPKIQKICDEAVADPSGLLSSDKWPQISLVVEDQQKGYVRALIGGWGEKKANRTLNRAMDTKRQPGSTFKVLAAYAPALDTGLKSLASTQDDAPYRYADGTPVRNWYGEAYRGISTLRQGIQDSLNIVAVKTLTDITPELGFSYLKEFGFTTLVESEEINGDIYSDVNQTLALGGLTYGVTNLELNAAYAAIANGGEYYAPKLYYKVIDRNANTILDTSSREPKRVIKETTAWLLTSAMQDVVTKGTGTAVNFGTTAIAGKTGTTSDYNDVWFSGYTNYYTATAWAGYDDNTKLSTSAEKALAKTIWRRAMEGIHAGLPSKSFERPAGIVLQEVCASSGDKMSTPLCTPAAEYMDKAFVPAASCHYHEKQQQDALQAQLQAAQQNHLQVTETLKAAQDMFTAAQASGDPAAYAHAKLVLDLATQAYNDSLQQLELLQNAVNAGAAKQQ